MMINGRFRQYFSEMWGRRIEVESRTEKPTSEAIIPVNSGSRCKADVLPITKSTMERSNPDWGTQRLQAFHFQVKRLVLAGEARVGSVNHVVEEHGWFKTFTCVTEGDQLAVKVNEP